MKQYIPLIDFMKIFFSPFEVNKRTFLKIMLYIRPNETKVTFDMFAPSIFIENQMSLHYNSKVAEFLKLGLKQSLFIMYFIFFMACKGIYCYSENIWLTNFKRRHL